MKLSEQIRNSFIAKKGLGQSLQCEQWADEVKQFENDFVHFYAKSNRLEAINAELVTALEGAIENTILLIEYAKPVYDEGYRIHTSEGMVDAIADVNEWQYPATTEANVRLLTAAPNMLKVLNMTIPYIARMVADNVQTVVPPQRILDLINKVINEASPLWRIT